MQFLANDKTEYSKEYCKHLEKGKDLNLTDQKKNNKLQVRQNSETHCKFREIYFHNIFEL